MRIVVAGAPPPSKTIERIERELGWEFIQIYGLTETSPLLTVNRAPAEWDALDAGGALRAAGPGRGARRRRADRRRPRGGGAGPLEPRVRGVLGAARGHRRRARGRLVPHRRRRLPGRLVPRDLGPQEGRHHHGRRERLLHRGRGLHLPAPGGGRGRRHRGARREVGRDDPGPRRGAGGDVGERERGHCALPGATGPLQGPEGGSRSATHSTGRLPANSRSTSCASRTGRARERAVN